NYRASRVLARGDASRDAVASALSKADIFHFAGHYVYDRGSPMRSGLLLAGRGDTLLPNHEIARMRLDSLRLVVLSACDTGSEVIVDGEGMVGAARTFLAAGVPLVVASHWAVDSEATAELMSQFHKFRKSDGLSSVRALRRAQLSMLESPNPRYREPFYWAPFIAYGADF
ncbi:MAG: CHAT domain-containing protein, partial [Pyrinomonadaceae bacterium]|nr:CHAT domain-containing protein [Pyrinomonadaceae bacterium]